MPKDPAACDIDNYKGDGVLPWRYRVLHKIVEAGPCTRTWYSESADLDESANPHKLSYFVCGVMQTTSEIETLCRLASINASEWDLTAMQATFDRFDRVLMERLPDKEVRGFDSIFARPEVQKLSIELSLEVDIREKDRHFADGTMFSYPLRRIFYSPSGVAIKHAVQTGTTSRTTGAKWMKKTSGTEWFELFRGCVPVKVTDMRGVKWSFEFMPGDDASFELWPPNSLLRTKASIQVPTCFSLHHQKLGFPVQDKIGSLTVTYTGLNPRIAPLREVEVCPSKYYVTYHADYSITVFGPMDDPKRLYYYQHYRKYQQQRWFAAMINRVQRHLFYTLKERMEVRLKKHVPGGDLHEAAKKEAQSMHMVKRPRLE